MVRREKKRIIEIWQPEYDKIGVKLTDKDALEILDSLTGFFKILAKWERESQIKEVVSPKVESKIIPKDKNKRVNADELSKIQDVPVSWIYQRTRLGQDEIPHIKMGKYLRFNPEEVIQFFRNKMD